MTNETFTQSRVLTYAEVAKRAGITRRTLERQLAVGEGPTVLHLSPARRAVLEADFEAWLQSRRKPAPWAKAPSSKGE